MSTNKDSTLFDPPLAPMAASKPKKIIKESKKMTPQDKKAIRSFATIATEIVIIAFIGSMIGAYFNARSIKDDCDRLGVSKVGDTYINCTIVVPVKDAATVPPR